MISKDNILNVICVIFVTLMCAVIGALMHIYLNEQKQPIPNYNLTLPPPIDGATKYRNVYLAPRFNRLVVVWPDGKRAEVTERELRERADGGQR